MRRCACSRTWMARILSLCLLGAAPAYAEHTRTAESSSSAPAWRELQDGVEYSTFRLVEKSDTGNGILHVVRVTPGRAELRAVLASEQRVPSRTAGRWAKEFGLAVVINAGMFQTDFSSNVGHLRNGTHLNNPGWNKYQSVLAFGPRKPGIAPVLFQDLDSLSSKKSLESYHTVIQNLRLIKGEGHNVWQPGTRRWSEAAVAADRQGRILFLFTRTPFAMHELNNRLTKLPLGIIRAMHVEGGPEASLSIRTDALSLDLSGSYETSFNENDGNHLQWPVPNVIGVVSKRKSR